MQRIKSNTFHWFIWLIAYVCMLGANGIANSTRWGGRTTGDVSASFPSLFTPAGFTFGIWGLIYLSLGVFIVVSWNKMDRWRMLTPLFVASCLLNMLWLYTWHHMQMGLSTLIIFILLGILLVIYHKLHNLSSDTHLAWWRFPWSMYTAWLCVASIANTSIWLVSRSWNAPAELMTIAVILVAVVLAQIFIVKRKDMVFASVFIWAFAGILVAREEVKEEVPYLYGALIGAMAFLVFSIIRSMQK
jgi:benzodiazapine receptor